MYEGTVIGFRSWRLNPKTYGLDGPVKHVEWPDSEPIVAECVEGGSLKASVKIDPDPHDSPGVDCMCGLYAYHDLEALQAASYDMHTHAVIGCAIYWGRISIHTIGFKAQYGRPLAISDQKLREDESSWEDLLEHVVSRYGIPVIPVDLLEPYALTWGQKLGTQFDTE